MPLRIQLPKLTIGFVKDTIYIIGVIIAVWFYFRDKTAKQAVFESQISTTIENQNNILNKLKEIDQKFEKQAETNGKVLMYIELDAPNK